MTATLPANFKASKPNITAQQLIKLPSATCKNGLLRKKGKGLNIGKWPFRFVVLSAEYVYVFSSETSKSPKSRFSLHGYNRVKRTEVKAHEWCFSIMPAPNASKCKEKTFACISDKERKAWMKAIRNQIYTANNISKPVPGIIDKLKTMSIGDLDNDDDYITVEESVYEPGDFVPPGLSKDSDEDDSDEDSFDSSSGESFVPVVKKTRSHSVPHVTHYADARSSSPCSYTDGTSERKKSSSSGHYDDVTIAPPKPHVPHETPKTTKVKRVPSDPMPKPPRYSAVCRESAEHDYGNESPGHDYANLPKNSDDTYYDIPPPIEEVSLERLCTVEDDNPDRDQLIIQLQAKKEPGTYLVRRSRSGNDKVIAYLTRNGHVKEYKILGQGSQFTLDQQKYFESVEDLLYHYTNVEPIPKSENFLKQGYHKVM